MRARKAIGLRVEQIRIACQRSNTIEPFGESRDRRLTHEHARHLVAHRFTRSAGSESNYWRAACLRLDDNHPEVFRSRKQDGCGLPIEIPDFFVAAPAEEIYEITAQSSKARLFGPSPYNFWPCPDLPAGLDRNV